MHLLQVMLRGREAPITLYYRDFQKASAQMVSARGFPNVPDQVSVLQDDYGHVANFSVSEVASVMLTDVAGEHRAQAEIQEAAYKAQEALKQKLSAAPKITPIASFN